MTYKDLVEDLIHEVRSTERPRCAIGVLVSPDFLRHLEASVPRSDLVGWTGAAWYYKGSRLLVDSAVEHYEILQPKDKRQKRLYQLHNVSRRLERAIRKVGEESGLDHEALVAKVHPDVLEILRHECSLTSLEYNPWRFERTQLIVTTDVDEFEVKPLSTVWLTEE